MVALVFVVNLLACSRSWLSLERMELAVSKSHLLGRVLMVMRERAVALGYVETENHEGESTGKLLSERTLRLVGNLNGTYFI